MSSDLYALSPPYTAILVVNTVLCVLGLVTAALRILSRKVRNAKLRPDDWCIICAVPLVIFMMVLDYIMGYYGGIEYVLTLALKHEPDPIPWISPLWDVVYGLSLYLSRMSILLLYLHLFDKQPRAPLIIKILMGLITVFTLAFIIQTFLICRPLLSTDGICEIRRAWARVAMSAYSAVSDIIVLNIPILALWKLRIDRQRKITLIVIFSSGLIVSIVAITECVLTLTLERENTPNWWIPIPLMVTEVMTCLVVACLPCIRPALGALMPSVFSTQRSGTRDWTNEDPEIKSLPFLQVDGSGNIVHCDLNHATQMITTTTKSVGKSSTTTDTPG